jgi:septation ring formation regulator EzrA
MCSVIKTKSGTLLCFCNSCDGQTFEAEKNHSEINVSVTKIPGLKRSVLVCIPKLLQKLDIGIGDFMITYFDQPNNRIDKELATILEKEGIAHA